MKHCLDLLGEFTVECVNPDGSVAWRRSLYNGIVGGGLNDLLSVYFGSGSQKANWYIGLIDDAGFSALAAGDSMSSHAGWTESVAYSQASRPQWSPTVGGGVAVNPAPTLFTFTGGVTLKGLFITSDPTKGGASGTLWSTAAFGALQNVVTGQVWRVVYNLRAAGGG